MTWRWVSLDVVHAIHDQALSDHGGGQGLRDNTLLESALFRAPNRAFYGKPGASELAAAYAFALARNHPYVDGNKRVAWISARLFLADNGYQFQFDPADAVRVMEGLAAGDLTEDQVAAWFRERIAR